MIEIKTITTKRLNALSVRLQNGAFYGILGARDAGKTELCEVLSGVRLPDAGRVAVNGFDIAKKPIEARKCVTYVPTGAPLYTGLTPYEYLTFVGESRGLSYERTVRLANEALGAYLPDRLRDKLIGRLNAEERLLLSVAAATVGQGDVILLDEPTEGLSTGATGRVKRVLSSLRETGKTVFLATRSASLCEQLCDRILVLDGGKLAYDLTGEELTALLAGGTPEDATEEDAEGARALLAAIRDTEQAPRVLKKEKHRPEVEDEYEELDPDEEGED